ncbi:hypothetical protein A2Z33_03490 [Candidatus Gottesmanbacteria bacterium RBG_16_52_11]|uniref:HMA domain-containing protein n=1 Tax=Candidatus Gottesmanbacteria bacterium RBG_16_52_11 TaxID=1798374 RepID=A0A1F5YWB7_9BACT|nr:MAG: hypothetical protein A2Z33_03490 [Candidatus Gottesmanbacteria bacterium RBG_16_52_11]
MIKKTLKVGDMHCTSCALMIEAELEDAGVKARCSYADQTLDVEYDESRVSLDTIREAVKKAGYTLTVGK